MCVCDVEFSHQKHHLLVPHLRELRVQSHQRMHGVGLEGQRGGFQRHQCWNSLEHFIIPCRPSAHLILHSSDRVPRFGVMKQELKEAKNAKEMVKEKEKAKAEGSKVYTLTLLKTFWTCSCRGEKNIFSVSK